MTVWKILKYKVKYFLKEVLLLYVWLQHDRSGEYKPRSSVPRHEIEAIVHTFYPAIAAFFESEEGKQEYEEWKAKREERKEKKTPAEQSAYHDIDKLLNDVQRNISSSIVSIDKEYDYVFHRMMKFSPCIFWNKDVYAQTVSLLEKLFRDHPNKFKIEADTYNYFLMGYNAYCQLCDTILDVSNFNIGQEIKTRLFRLPTYSIILESCLSNFLRLIAVITGQGVGKDYTAQNKLGQLVDVMYSNGYTEISQRINVNIRNAINHGKVLMIKSPSDQICFYYVENRSQKRQEMSIYEFDNMINNRLFIAC